MERTVELALGAAIVGALGAFVGSLYLWGMPSSFLAFFVRTLAVIGTTLALIFGLIFRGSSLDA